MVDIISGGRLELGLGAGYRVPEFELFGTDFTARYRLLDNQVGELRRLWGEGGLTPAPVQDSCRSGWATRARKAPGGQA